MNENYWVILYALLVFKMQLAIKQGQVIFQQQKRIQTTTTIISTCRPRIIKNHSVTNNEPNYDDL